MSLSQVHLNLCVQYAKSVRLFTYTPNNISILVAADFNCSVFHVTEYRLSAFSPTFLMLSKIIWMFSIRVGKNQWFKKKHFFYKNQINHVFFWFLLILIGFNISLLVSFCFNWFQNNSKQ